jgi:hypothetical protein
MALGRPTANAGCSAVGGRCRRLAVR